MVYINGLNAIKMGDLVDREVGGGGYPRTCARRLQMKANLTGPLCWANAIMR